MEKILVFIIVVVSFAASADADIYYGTLSWTSADIGPYCEITTVGNLVLANNNVWNDGQTCGYQVHIDCNDARYCSVPTNTSATIAGLCDGCEDTLTLPHAAFSSFVPAPTAVDIIYVM